MAVTKLGCKHDDCMNLSTIDVAKGYCHCNKATVLIDTPICPKFSLRKKCGNCKNFKRDEKEENLGVCMAEKHQPWTYPDLITQSCEMYQAG